MKPFNYIFISCNFTIPQLDALGNRSMKFYMFIKAKNIFLTICGNSVWSPPFLNLYGWETTILKIKMWSIRDYMRPVSLFS